MGTRRLFIVTAIIQAIAMALMLLGYFGAVERGDRYRELAHEAADEAHRATDGWQKAQAARIRCDEARLEMLHSCAAVRP